MRIPWLPILGAIVAVVLVKVVGRYFGTTASLAALGALMLAWWCLHLYYKRRMRQLHEQLESLDEEERRNVLAQLDPEMRKDIERVAIEMKKWPNKSPEPTPTAVTPRATEMKSERKQSNLGSTEARVAPAVVVAHL